MVCETNFRNGGKTGGSTVRVHHTAVVGQGQVYGALTELVRSGRMKSVKEPLGFSFVSSSGGCWPCPHGPFTGCVEFLELLLFLSA